MLRGPGSFILCHPPPPHHHLSIQHYFQAIFMALPDRTHKLTLRSESVGQDILQDEETENGLTIRIIGFDFSQWILFEPKGLEIQNPFGREPEPHKLENTLVSN